jgi:F-type H+-transporting ATPase subunit gamma
VKHPLLEPREDVKSATLLVLTANRGLCGGYNGSILRAAIARMNELKGEGLNLTLEVSGKRGIANFKFRKIDVAHTFTQFDDQPKFDEVEAIANRYLAAFASGEMDRLDVAYTKFISAARQQAVVETLLPFGQFTEFVADRAAEGTRTQQYEFLPSAGSILEEVVPMSFKVKLFKCFLDAAVSEQIARRTAMKAATENASDMIKQLSSEYNRARQSQITGEIMEIIGGANALKG